MSRTLTRSVRRSVRRALIFGAAAGVLGTGGAWGQTQTVRVWPTATISYRDLTGRSGYADAISRAVAAWNNVDIGVRLRPAVGGSADIQFVVRPGRCLSGAAGTAPLGFQRFGARVVLRACPRIVRPLLVAHEIGRVLGLTTDNRTCSLMNSKGASDGRTFAEPADCSRYVPPSWLSRLVDPASAARARTLYAAPPAALDVRLTPAVTPRLDWREPRGIGMRTLVLRTARRCPTSADLLGRSDAVIVYSSASYAGLHWVVDKGLPAPATYCYRLFNLSRFGRPTPSSPFTFVLPLAPAAAMTVTSAAIAGQPTSFSNQSTGDIVGWHWDFGDPSSGSANTLDTTDPRDGRSPSHTYAAAGSYTVTLTVIDELGRSATTSLDVTVT